MRQHLSDGQLQAFLDGELDDRQRRLVSDHLGTCLRCQEALSTTQAQNGRLMAVLTGLAPEKLPPVVVQAEIRLEERLNTNQTKENFIMKRIFSPKYRAAWVAGAVVLLIVAAMAFAPVRVWANNFLSLFRVEQVMVIEVDPDQLAAQLENSSVNLESLISDNLTFEGSEEAIQVDSVEDAASAAGFPIRMPSEKDGELELEVVPGGKMTFEIDLPRIQALLQAIGRPDLELPGVLDGTKVTLTIPSAVNARWGNCEFDKESLQQEGFDPDDLNTYPTPDCTSLYQMPSPTIVAPPGVDINQMGEVYLQLLGMSQEEAASYAATIDWASTFVLPIPRYDATYRTINVDGVQGTIIQDARSSYNDSYALLIWVKDGMLYALSGPGDAASVLEIANSMK